MEANEKLQATFQKHLVPQLQRQEECKPWWWPKSPGRCPEDWGLTDAQTREYESLSEGMARVTARSKSYEGFVGSVAATEGSAWLLSIRPSCGSFARSVGPLYTSLMNFAKQYDSNMVPELHVTDLVKFRGHTEATLWTAELTKEMIRISIECLYDEYVAIRPPLVLLVDLAAKALRCKCSPRCECSPFCECSPLCKTGKLRNEWRSNPRSVHLDSMLSNVQSNSFQVPFWGQGNQVAFGRALANALGDYRKSRSRNP